MTKLLTLILGTLFSLQLAHASAPRVPNVIQKSFSENILDQFATSSQTTQLEYGCPVHDLDVPAENKKAALNAVVLDCQNQIREAATKRDGVAAVVDIQVIWPDVQVTEKNGRYSLVGTIFYETIVLLKLQAGK